MNILFAEIIHLAKKQKKKFKYYALTNPEQIAPQFMDFKEEKKLTKKGYQNIYGLDEVGRGALAGPVVACALNFYSYFKALKHTGDLSQINKIKDSKHLTPKTREKLYYFLAKKLRVDFTLGIISFRVIDKINILEATKLAMLKAIKKLKKEPDFLLIDGNFLLNNLAISQKAVVSGDEKIISCAVASIIAKVSRDKMMLVLDKKYPQYNFRQHKGYGTKEHFKALKKYGPCPIHRRSFRPIRNQELGIRN